MKVFWRLTFAILAMSAGSWPVAATTFIMEPAPPRCTPVSNLGPEAPAVAQMFNSKIKGAVWQRCLHFDGRIGYDAMLTTRSTANVCRVRWRSSWGADDRLNGDPWGEQAYLWQGTGACPAFEPRAELWMRRYTQVDPRLTDEEYLRLTSQSFILPKTIRLLGERRMLSPQERGALVTRVGRTTFSYSTIQKKTWIFGLWKTYIASPSAPINGYRLQFIEVFGHLWLRRVDRLPSYNF